MPQERERVTPASEASASAAPRAATVPAPTPERAHGTARRASAACSAHTPAPTRRACPATTSAARGREGRAISAATASTSARGAVTPVPDAAR